MNKENFKTIILFNLVAISVFLSYNLWTYQARFSLTESSSSLENISLANQRNITNVVEPSHVVYHAYGSHFMSVQALDVGLVTTILESGEIGNVTNISEGMSTKEIQNLVTETGRLEIVYPTPLTMNILKKMYTIDENKYGTIQVNRIIIDLDKQSEGSVDIYFVSLENGEVLQASLSNVSHQSLLNIADNFSTRIPEAVAHTLGSNGIIYLPKNSVTLRKVDLLAEYISTDTFKQALFSTTKYLTTETEGTVTSYTDGIRLLEIDSNTGNLSYLDPSISEESQMNGSELISQSVEFINGHDGWTNAYNLSSWNAEKAKVIFRMTKDGIPIFGGGEITQIWGDEKPISYKRSAYQFDDTFQLTQADITLPSGIKVLAAIEEVFATSDTLHKENIQNIMIAYEMQSVDGAISEFAYDYFQLVPIWCVKYNGNYYKLMIEENGSIRGELIGLE